jgi:hypothetical protein
LPSLGRSTLRTQPIPRWLELTGAALLFTVLSFAVFGWYAFHGGFVADDWVNADHYYFHSGSGFWDAVGNYQTPSRPVAAVYVSLTYAALGMHLHYHLVLSVLLAAFLSIAFFAFLRTVGLGLTLALAAAVLLLMFPSSDSTRLWSTASQIDLFIGLYLVAAAIAIAGRRRFGPAPTTPAVIAQVLASALAVTAVAGYEIVAPAVLLSVILYRLTDGGGGAIWRWLLDAIPTLLVLVLFTRKFGDGGDFGLPLLANLRLVGDGAVSVLGYSLFPARATSGWAVLAGVAAVIVVMLLVRRTAAATPDRDSIIRWLRPTLLAIAGIVVGYLMIIPAGDRYPLYAAGVQNRANCFAALGFSALVVFVLAAVAAVIVAAVPRLPEEARTRLRGILTGSLVLFMIGVYTVRMSEDGDRWVKAAELQAQILGGAHELVPSPPTGSTIFTSPFPGYASPSLPVFGGGGNNDELGAFKVSYGRADLRAFPLLDGVGAACGPTSMATPDAGNSRTAYGKAILINFRVSAVYRPMNRSECLRDTEAMKPYGPVNFSDEW